jgi:putative DNA primase/helicase
MKKRSQWRRKVGDGPPRRVIGAMSFTHEHLAGKVDFLAYYHSEGVQFRGKQALCPFHDDHTSSLSIDPASGLWKCHGPCAFGGDAVTFVEKKHGLSNADAIAYLRERRLTGNGNGHATQVGGKGVGSRREVAVYDYQDEAGNLLCQTVRFDPKDFRQRRPDGAGGLVWNLKGTRRVLYRLPELMAADAGQPVFVVEGEKDVERLRQERLVATCNPMGAGKWCDEFNEALRGRWVVVIADNDKAGRDHAAQVAQALSPVAKKVARLELDGLPHKGDVSDWIAAGHTSKELLQLAVLASPPPGGEASTTRSLGTSPTTRVTVANLMRLSAVTRKKVEWLWYGRIARGKLTDLFGDGNLGKSTMLTDIAARVTRGRALPDESDDVFHTPRTVIVLTAEDGIEDTLKARFDEAGGDGNRLEVLTSVTRADGTADMLSLTQDAAALIEACRRTNAALCTIDPFSAYLGNADAWKDQEVRRVLGTLKDGIEPLGTAIVLLRHPPKSRTENPMHAGGGSIAISAACRTGMMVVADPQDPARRLLAPYKYNLTKKVQTLAFRLKDSPQDPDTAVVEWEVGTDPRDARQLLAEGGQTYEQQSALGDACGFLREFLAEGPQPAETVKAEAKTREISYSTLRRAYDDIGAKPKKDSFSGPWLWRLR